MNARHLILAVALASSLIAQPKRPPIVGVAHIGLKTMTSQPPGISTDAASALRSPLLSTKQPAAYC